MDAVCEDGEEPPARRSTSRSGRPRSTTRSSAATCPSPTAATPREPSSTSSRSTGGKYDARRLAAGGRQEGIGEPADVLSARVSEIVSAWTWTSSSSSSSTGSRWAAVYALIALGYTMVYGILKLLNFAHGDVYMIGRVRRLRDPDRARRPRSRPSCPSPLLILLMFAGAMLGSGRARRRDRALRLPAAAQRAADRTADLRARRFVLPPDDGAAALRRRLPHLRHLRVHRPRDRHPLGAAEHLGRADHGHPHLASR